MITLNKFILEKKHDFPYDINELIKLMTTFQLSAKIIHNYINRRKIEKIIIDNKSKNVHGENQTKLDIFANKKLKYLLKSCNVVAGIGSEEESEFINFNNNAKYIVLIDPLDGSSNISVNIVVGTIFSIYHRISKINTHLTINDFIQPGNKQIAAGYIIYGPSTMMVYTTGCGVHIFSYDPLIKLFFLNCESIKIPKKGFTYSINEGNYINFSEGIKKYIKFCQQEDTLTNRPYSARYIGSLVADFHRNLIQGGIYLYPSTKNFPKGKLRLLYECNPIAFIAEQSGGKASNGKIRILNILPKNLHQKCPFFTGNNEMVDKVEEFLFNYEKILL